jgi:manganese transport system ATP-binding protein
MGAAVEARGLRLSRGGRIALRPADFVLPAGKLTALIGPNGSGKTTILHAIAGLLAPDAGTIVVLGRSPSDARRDVAYVLQTVHPGEQLPITVRETVAMGRYAVLGAFRRLGRDDRARIASAMDRLAIAGLASRQLLALSSGQRQRALVAQGLAQDAQLLLLDEPITGLDIPSRERILAAIREERERGRTVVLTTHDLGDAGAADHVLLLAGRVVAAGGPQDVLTREHLTEAYGEHMLRVEDGTVMLDEGLHHEH